jgi:hypothetical protein
MDRRAQQDVREAKATRERLEKGSPSAGRRDFAGIINALVADARGGNCRGSRRSKGSASSKGWRLAVFIHLVPV